jgi:hypothetical protein
VSQHRTVWWSWLAPETRSVSVVVGGAETPKVAVYSGSSLTALSLVTTNYPIGLAAGAATFNAVAGTQYQLAIFLSLSQMGEFQFSLVPNDPPNVQIVSPASSAAFHPGESISLVANAFDPDGAIARVQFDTKGFSRVVLTNPYASSVTNLGLGDYSFTARATDNLGAFTFSPSLNIRVAPLNDEFAHATIIQGTSTQVMAQNLGASKEEGEPEHAAQPGGRSIWFSWTAPVGGRFAVSAEGSSFDTLLAIYSGRAVSNLTLLAQNDNRTFFDTWSKAQFTAEMGRTYFIAVDGHAGATGNSLLTLTPVAENDDFAGAIHLSGTATFRTHNRGAGEEPGEPFHGALPASGSLWWNWTAPASGRYVTTTAGSDFDTVLAIYAGESLSNLTLVASDDDGAGNRNTVARFDAVAGQQYRITVAGYGGAQGQVQLTIATNGVPTLFDPATSTSTGFVFRAFTEPGTTNIAQRSMTLTNWTPFSTRVATDWWIDFQDPLPPTNATMFYRVVQQ